MNKIPTLFRRNPDDMKHVLPEVNPECQWVLDGEGVATRKYHGTCVMLDEAGAWWARREVKPGKSAPHHFRAVQQDPNTGKIVGWEPIEQSSFVKFHDEALLNDPADWDPGTYELIGVKVNGNPERIDPGYGHQLIAHRHAEVLDAPRDFDGLRDWLLSLAGYEAIEGVVWHNPDGRMAKLKCRDFA